MQALIGLSTVFIDEQAMNVQNFDLIPGLKRDTAEQITKIVSKYITKKQV